MEAARGVEQSTSVRTCRRPANERLLNEGAAIPADKTRMSRKTAVFRDIRDGSRIYCGVKPNGSSTLLAWVYASMPSGPFSRPIPEFLYPPNGAPGSKAYMFTA